MVNIEGSCLCESIRYSCSSGPLFTAICNCAACQKLTGSAFIVVVGIHTSNFQLTGDEYLKKYEYIGDSGKPAIRCFCKNCGSLMYGLSAARPQVINITAGTLKDKSWIQPQMHVYWRDHFDFLQHINDIPKYEIMPDARR